MAVATRKQAKSNTGKSGSDLADRKPVGGKKSADGSGHNGAALAATMLREIESRAKEDEIFLTKRSKDQKADLKRLERLDADSLVAYVAEMQKRQEQSNEDAKKQNLSGTDYRANNPRENSIYVQCSMWIKMARAVRAGMPIDYNLPWTTISKQATDALNAAAAKEAQAKASEAIKKIMADAKLTEEQRKARIAALEADMKAKPQRGRSRKEETPAMASITPEMAAKAEPGTATAQMVFNELCAKAEKLFLESGYPLHVIEDAYVWLGKKVAEKHPTTTRAVNQALKNSATTGTPTEPKADKPTAPVEEKAVAKTTRRSTRK